MTKENHWIDRTIAAGLAGVVMLLLVIWPFTGLHPYVWDETAIAAGLLPANEMLPGLGIYLAHLIFAIFPYGFALHLVGFFGILLAGVAAYLMYGIASYMMELVSGFGARDWPRRRLAIRVASGVAALLFACSDPMWHVAQGLTGSTFVIFLILLSCWLFVRFLARATFKLAVSTLCTLGLLTAETPLGWLLLAAFAFFTIRFVMLNKTEEWVEFLDPTRMQKTKWSMTFAFLGALLIGIFFEGFAFAMMDGLKANAVTAAELPARYLTAYLGQIASAANLPGFALFIGLALIPFALTSIMILPATDEEHYLSFKYSIIYFLCGFLAFLQVSPFSVTWFWNVATDVSASRVTILFGVFLDAVALAWAFFVLGVEIFCRDYQHIESVLYQNFREQDEDEDDSEAAEPASAQPLGEADERIVSVPLSAGRLGMLALPLLLVILVVGGRRLVEDRQLQRVIHAFVQETIIESQGSPYLFTDGSYDAYLRLEAKRSHAQLIPISVMGGSSPRAAYIRQMDTPGFEDRVSLETGATEALRTWIVAKSERVPSIALQLAFEFLRLNRRLRPVVYGLLVRPEGGDIEAANASIERCHRLSEAIVQIQERGIWRHAKDEYLKDRFLFAQFRLAVISRLRAVNLDLAKRVKESIAEIAFSDRLNACNPSLAKILKRMDWMKRQNGEDLTPREGLEVAMKRADFVMARRYAVPVIREDPDEPNANFALGMSYYAEEQFAKAEEYLQRVLKRNPNEPAVYNNLALIYLKTDRLNEATTMIKKALELNPERPEIKDTERQIEAAVREANDPQLKLKKEMERRSNQ